MAKDFILNSPIKKEESFGLFMITDVEQDNIIFTANGFSIRAKLDIDENKKNEVFNTKERFIGKWTEIHYYGNINNIFEVEFIPIKEFFIVK